MKRILKGVWIIFFLSGSLFLCSRCVFADPSVPLVKTPEWQQVRAFLDEVGDIEHEVSGGRRRRYRERTCKGQQDRSDGFQKKVDELTVDLEKIRYSLQSLVSRGAINAMENIWVSSYLQGLLENDFFCDCGETSFQVDLGGEYKNEREHINIKTLRYASSVDNVLAAAQGDAEWITSLYEEAFQELRNDPTLYWDQAFKRAQLYIGRGFFIWLDRDVTKAIAEGARAEEEAAKLPDEASRKAYLAWARQRAAIAQRVQAQLGQLRPEFLDALYPEKKKRE